MSSVVDEVTALCARGYQTGSLLLRGSPAAAGWVLGWLSAEFAPHVLTGHVLSAVPSPLERMARGLAVQRADAVLEDALSETFGGDYPTAVHHPLEHYAARRPNLAALVAAMRDRRRYSATTSNKIQTTEVYNYTLVPPFGRIEKRRLRVVPKIVSA